VLVATLGRGLIDPDVVIFPVLPEHAIWLCYTWACREDDHLKIDLHTEA